MRKRFKKLSLFSIGVLIVLFFTSCGNQAVQAPAGTTQGGSEAETPENSGDPTQAPSAGSEWETIVEAAKKEGRLILSGPPGELWRTALIEDFQQQYPEIKVEYTGSNSRDFWPRLQQERQIGEHLWDLRVGGPDPQVYSAVKDGTLAPVRPLLFLPDVTDEDKWLGGLDGLFADEGNEYLPGFHAYIQTPAHVNRDFLSEEEFSSAEQLIDPVAKGKIVLQDPRGGAGLGFLAVLLEAYGEDFVRQLLTTQEVVVTSDNRQQAEWIVRGRYPIAIGLLPDEMMKFEEQGLGTNVQFVENAPIGLSIGFGGIQYLSDAPNPNAAIVYINWLLSQEGQQFVADVTKLNSRRIDVNPGNEAVVAVPEQLDQYIAHQEEHMLPVRAQAQALANELIK